MAMQRQWSLGQGEVTLARGLCRLAGGRAVKTMRMGLMWDERLTSRAGSRILVEGIQERETELADEAKTKNQAAEGGTRQVR